MKRAEMSPKSLDSLRLEIATRGRKLEEGRHGRRKKLPIWSILFVTVSITKRRLSSQTLKTQKNNDVYSKLKKDLRERLSARGQELQFTVAQLRNKLKKAD